MSRSRLVERLLPPTPLARSLSIVSGLYAVGSGAFLTGTAVYFTQIVGIRPAMVGLGVSIAGLVAFAVAVPAGRLADVLGSRRVWLVAAVLEGLSYLCYPWIRGFGAFIAVLSLIAMLESAGNSARGAYILGVVERGERVQTLAFVRSALNIGFTIGAGISGIALSTNNDGVIKLVPVVTSVIMLATAGLVARLDPVEGNRAASEVISTRALRNPPFLLLSLINGVLGANQTLLAVVLPLWLVTSTDAPHAWVAWLYATNTVLVVALQVSAARGSETVRGALRAALLGVGCLAVACAAAFTSYWTTGAVTVLVLWIAYVGVTGAELFGSASAWGLLAELSDPRRQGEYQGTWRLGTQLQRMIGPAVCTWLTISWGPQGFLVIAGFLICAALVQPKVARAAQQAVDTIP